MTIKVPVETLRRWRQELGKRWFITVDDEGDDEGGDFEEVNDEEVIVICKEIDVLLKHDKR